MPAETQPTNTTSLLQQAVQATKQTDPAEAKDLLQNIVSLASTGAITLGNNLESTITAAIAAIDQKISTQLATLLHTPKFQILEGSWRGLHYLVKNTETGESLKIKVLNMGKDELAKDMSKAVEFDQSQLFKKVYEEEYGSPGGEPYGVLIGDYSFTNNPMDIDLLSSISGVAAAAFAPFIASADAQLFGFDSWIELSKPRDLAKNFESDEYAQWNSFRASEDSRFVTLVLPRTLARLPYGKSTAAVDAFDFEEVAISSNGMDKPVSHENYSWMNTAYVFAARLTDAFAQYGWCTAIRGAEGGGKVDGLPAHVFLSDDGDVDMACPTEIGITDRREAELSKLGFLAICHYKHTDYAVFFGSQTTQQPKQYDNPDATANAAISARLPYILATSRFAHYLKIMARDKIGSFMEVQNAEAWLNRWIQNYVNGNANVSAEIKAKYPLAEAKITVTEIPGRPGSFQATAWLRPWLQLEELTASMRLVASIPKLA